MSSQSQAASATKDVASLASPTQEADPAQVARTARIWGNVRIYGVLTGLIVVWEILGKSGLFEPIILPAFTDVLKSVWVNAVEGDLFLAIGWSCYRVFMGFGLGMLLAVPLGVAIGWSRVCEDLFNPIVEILRPIPPLAWIPLSIIWLGVGFKSVLFITTLGSFFPILVATIAGVRNVDRRMIEFARTLGASTGQILLKVVIPAAMPQTFVGMRIAVGFSWMVVVAAEMISVKYGLGWLIWKARFSFDTATVMAGMAIIGLLSVLMTKAMIYLEGMLFSWKKGIVKG
ncbi:taurine transport system permease protein TauC [Afipia carboxidovorans OM5]|uniref:ABC transporter permease n=1 Tax=Afipia carboxidovorans (strain ATCC 49405 / DSM 1227 / KCTC 32145 / OM5) TaxID=504832 RepID=B6JEQ6_AFIC5|nr:ABC transporter permease [Afipia carboxidovorans]ACI92778.1 taurine transport system permease protein TauC [Afipia carboxidovorans OM5]AEI03476.1 ABC transporter permease [Afipia carboxidovorans OM4]AEI07053.1 ABC transporter permease [Afipia carboxidovorans OM5]BEV44364.1 ABC transporter permease [Afipia carboxidovorans]